MGEECFTEPFCHKTLHKLASRPFNQLFRQQTTLDHLLDRARSHPGLPLKGIVFHMSRCGSTLAAQWLAALTDSVVLSELPPLNTLLECPKTIHDSAMVHALLSAMGQPRRTDDHHLFLKIDCWHMAHIDRILAAFPDTPWIFLYRNPIEVMVSHKRMPGWHMVPGSMTNHSYHAPDVLMNYPLGDGAWVLSRILEQAHQAILHHGNGLLLNYASLPDAMKNSVANHFGLELSSSNKDALNRVCRRNSKQTHETFHIDTDEKRHAADDEISELAIRWLNKPYKQLEQLRIKSQSSP